MARKQNGFGNPKSLGFKAPKSISKGKRPGAAGLYPSDRRYGSSVQRSIIEQYDINSDWTKWRRGFEYYNKGAWYRLKTYDPITKEYTDSQIKSKLYQGTDFEVDVVFDGYKFATKNADSNNHYVMKRVTTSDVDLGVITSVLNDELKYPEQKAYSEIWCKGSAGTDTRLLFQMIGERLTDGETEATLTYLLTEDNLPALYIGKSNPNKLTEVRAEINTAVLNNTVWMQNHNNNYQDLVGKVVYIPQFFVERPISSPDIFTVFDERDFFGASLRDGGKGEIVILDNDTDLPPSLYDISELEPIVSDPNGSYVIEGEFIYRKDTYQRFYGNQYITGQLVESNVNLMSYSVMPFVILGVEEKDGKIEIISEPFISELKLYQPAENGTLVFTDYSFTKTAIDEYEDEYYHALGAPSDRLWLRLDTDINPWMDEVFTTGNHLRPATIYTCSCPSYSKAMLRAPQDTEDEGKRKINRQRRYPLPTAQGRKDYDQIGLGAAAGKMESWETRKDRMSFKMCKHTIATMFIEHLKVREPASYPTVDAREQFEAKLAEDIAEVGEEFGASYRRGGLTTLEIIFALAQGLNLDETELAYVVLNSKF
tara:strand:+ start:1131 stop:2918 length:1788 start_codon:yes stop_codon:yes gene_type:complete